MEMNPHSYDNHPYALQDGVLVFSATEQRQIGNRLRSMVSLRSLKISGHPIDLIVVGDMPFSKRLEFASVHLSVRVPMAEIDSQRESIVTGADEWLPRNQGWSYHLNEAVR